MAKTLEQLQAQIDALQAKAEAIRQKERVEVIARIREAIGHYGITSSELFRGRPAKKAKAQAMYSDGANTWSGRGRRPRWVVEALEAGKTLEDLKR